MTIDPTDSIHLSHSPGSRQRSPRPLAPDAIVLKADERPIWPQPFHTGDLPDTPERHRRLPASGWVESPLALRNLGVDLGYDVVHYVRRIGNWFLWRSGPATDGDARYGAIDARTAGPASTVVTFRLFADGVGQGHGPDDSEHTRFRTWKESLRDAP